MLVSEVQGLAAAYGKLAPFHYYKDKYALSLMAWAAGDGLKVADAKRSPWAGLLQKSLLKAHCAQHPMLRAADLLNHQPQEPWTFRRIIDSWGEEDRWQYAQVSRPGTSLVLRLDFDAAHDALIDRLRLQKLAMAVKRRVHLNEGDTFNMAWCRMDLDWDTGEVLIEEIQNDWLRHCLELLVYESHQDIGNPWYISGSRARRANDLAYREYQRLLLEPLQKIWSEAMLCAALDFVRNDLGLGTVYMHTAETGARLKGINYRFPPQSLYQDLPRRFCFQATREVPAFLQRAWHQHGVMRDTDQRWRYKEPMAFWKLDLWPQ